MIYLALSTLALVAGPFVFAMAAGKPAAREGLEGFILVTLVGIVCLHIAPEAWHVAGPASVVAGLLGLAFPAVLERVFRQALSRAHLVVLALAGAGIVVHAILDGIALLPAAHGGEVHSGHLGGAHAGHGGEAGQGTGSRALAIGVIIHRLPVGMAIWWVLRPQFGTAVAVSTFTLIIVTTVFSYLVGSEFFHAADWSLALFQAFVAGSLVHVALVGTTHGRAHGQGAEPATAILPRRLQSRAYLAGLLLGLVTAFVIPHVSG